MKLSLNSKFLNPKFLKPSQKHQPLQIDLDPIQTLDLSPMHLDQSQIHLKRIIIVSLMQNLSLTIKIYQLRS